ncbi:MAG: glycosyltransferase family 2 protein [Candidatus Margulisiibacteriota bacterium]|nr:glycosyltransferase family 2 protein [Candidatus Margulisiibacteriota bacterium]
MKLTVIATVFNEVKTVCQAIKDIEKIKVPEKEVIIIDNCSTDGSRKLLEELEANDFKEYKYIYNDKNLKCGNFIIGRDMANGEYIYLHHTDLEYDPGAAMEMLAVAEQGSYDVILGSRLKDNKDSMWSIMRKRPEYLATIISTALVNKWYGKKFTDIIGTRLYRTSTIRKVPTGTTGYGFEFGFVTRMCKLGLKIAEIAVPYKPRVCKRDKKVKPYHMLNALFEMFKARYF